MLRLCLGFKLCFKVSLLLLESLDILLRSPHILPLFANTSVLGAHAQAPTPDSESAAIIRRAPYRLFGLPGPPSDSGQHHRTFI